MTASKANQFAARGWTLLILGLSLMVSGIGAEAMRVDKFSFEGATFSLPVGIVIVGLFCLAVEPAGQLISKTKWGKK